VRALDKLNSPLVVLGVLVLIVGLNVLLYFFYHYEQMKASATDTSALPTVDADNNNFAAAAVRNPTSSEEKGLPVVVWVAEAPAGLSIYEDGQLIVDQVGEPGFSQELEPQEDLTISTDNAGAVRTKLGEWDLGPLGESGEAVTRDFTAGS
jgi:Domain of unknown function (DUF4115)